MIRSLVLVCGSRSWPDRTIIENRIAQLDPGTIIITGGASGADAQAAQAAREHGLFVAEFAVTGALWRRHGKAAGILRNHAMLDLHPDLVIAFTNGDTPGTDSTIAEARRRGISVETVRNLGLPPAMKA